MARATWWGTRRFGLFVHANLATVPAWAPIGQYADWYQCHLGEPVPDVVLHPSPMVEVLAHHRERWAHIATFDEFLPLLTYDHFDADEWAELAQEAGMGYAVLVTKHHDGLCWWDAPGTDRTVMRDGPRRNVLAEFAAACDTADLIFGTYYSLLDWGDPRYPGPEYVDQVLHPQVLDLVDRYGSRILWGDGHWGHGPDHWRSEELIARARAIRGDLMVNDRWWIAEPDLRCFEYEIPDRPLDTPWELCRGLAHSFCHNRNERAEHHLDAAQIIALLTEVVAKGGNLLLNVGPTARGEIPDLQRQPLREAGRWIRAHAELLDDARPADPWGDDQVHCWQRGERSDGATDLVVVDHARRGRLTGLGRDRGRVVEVSAADGAPIDWQQGEDAVTVRRSDRRPLELAAVYCVRLEPVANDGPTLFPPPPPQTRRITFDPAAIGPGAIWQLGDGFHQGPVEVPAGVTLRGLGPERTILSAEGATAVTLRAGARLEHLSVRTAVERVAWFPRPTVILEGPETVVLGCRIDGHVIAGPGARHARIRGSGLTGVVTRDADRVVISHCRLTGNRWDVGVESFGGDGLLIESCEFHDHLAAIRLTGATHPIVRNNMVTARWWAVQLVDVEGAHVVANSVLHTMRAVDVDGGAASVIDANAVAEGDSGCIVQRGAADVTISGNRWEQCRIGVLAWDAGPLTVQDNDAVDLHDSDAAVTIGPIT